MNRSLLVLTLTLSLAATSGCAKKSEPQKPVDTRENLTNSDEVSWAFDSWRGASILNSGEQIIASKSKRTLLLDQTAKVDKNYPDAPPNTICRVRMTGVNLEIFRKNGTVYEAEARLTKAELIPSEWNTKPCAKYIEALTLKAVSGNFVVHFPFTKATDEQTGAIYFNDLSAEGGRKFSRLRGIKKDRATCIALTGIFANQEDLDMKRTHDFDQSDCKGFYYLEHYKGSSELSKYNVADDNWEDLETSAERVVKEKRKLTEDTLEVMKIENYPRTRDEIVTTTYRTFNEWNDIFERVLVKKNGVAQQPIETTRYRQAF